MDAELKAKLLDYMTHLEEAAKKGGEFAAEQAPLAVQEYVTFAVAYHGGLVFAGVALFVATLLAGRAAARYVHRDDFESELSAIVTGVGIPFGLIAGFVSVCMVAANLRPFLLAWLAPRVFILEAVADLVK